MRKGIGPRKHKGETSSPTAEEQEAWEPAEEGMKRTLLCEPEGSHNIPPYDALTDTGGGWAAPTGFL